MNEESREALKYSIAGVLLVIISGVAAQLFAPEESLGKGLKFALPVLTGVAAGLWIHSRFKDSFEQPE